MRPNRHCRRQKTAIYIQSASSGYQIGCRGGRKRATNNRLINRPELVRIEHGNTLKNDRSDHGFDLGGCGYAGIKKDMYKKHTNENI